MTNSLFRGKTCLITGATSGIGLAVAHELARRGFSTLLVGRNPKKCERIWKRVKKSSGNSEVAFFIADLSFQDDIRCLADQITRRYDKLDVLVNNAGARFLSRCTTKDGHEMTFALNHLAYFLLTHLLLGCLKASGNARVINISSWVHRIAAVDFNDLFGDRQYVGKSVYAQSKLANVLFTYELAKRMDGHNVTANAVEPGNVFTNFSRNNGWISWLKHVGAHLLARNLISPREAAETIVYLASSPEVQGVTGKYFYVKKPIPSSSASYDHDVARQLWELSLEMTGLADSS